MYTKTVLRTVLSTALLLDTEIGIARPIQRSAYRPIHRATAPETVPNVCRSSGYTSHHISLETSASRLTAAPKMAPAAGTEPTPETTREMLSEITKMKPHSK